VAHAAGVRINHRKFGVTEIRWLDARSASGSESQVWLYAERLIQPVAKVNVGDLAVAGGCIA
jgi:hypothetical protein